MAIRQRNLDALHSVALLAPTVVSAANDTTAVDCSAFDGDVCLILNAAASAAASAMEVKLQHGDESNGSDAVDVPGGAFATLADADSHQKVVVSKDDLKKYLRLSFHTETGTYSAAVAVSAVGMKRRIP